MFKRFFLFFLEKIHNTRKEFLEGKILSSDKVNYLYSAHILACRDTRILFIRDNNALQRSSFHSNQSSL